jgi:hypothetical protein
MSIRCGTCRQRHETIADVRACAERGYGTDESVDPTTDRTGAAAPYDPRPRDAEPQEPATEKQVNFMLALEAQKIAEPLRKTRDELAGMTKKAATLAIGELLKRPDLPGRQNKTPNLPDVPAGRYAIGTPAKFYKVDRPTEGRWAGYTFVKVQASDEFHPVNRSLQPDILAEIAKDPQAAMLRYGREIGECGHCGRTLTNQESRDAGIGPICAGKMGW